jgi:serine/threonine-protein kinase
MTDTAAVQELVLRWQELREQGQVVSAEELCAGRSDLLDDLRRQIEALRSMEQFLDATADTPEEALDEDNAPFPKLTSPLPTRLQSGRTPGAQPSGATLRPEDAGGFDSRDYELLARMGRGGMGEVFRGKDPALGRDLAVKVLQPKLCGDPDAEDRFLQEARITGALQHPNIVPVHNLGRLPDGRLYFTMKLVRGRTLADMLAEGVGAGRLPGLLAVFEKVCQAAAFAHSRGVIHRDLKPANIMVGAFGEVQVMDWGLAKALRRDDGAGTAHGECGGEGDTVRRILFARSPVDNQGTGVVGTPSYMAPEQARGAGDAVDERADVFGLGAILCEVLTGRPPYSGGSLDAILRQAASGETVDAFARLDECGADADLVTLCKLCLAAERGDRPRDGGGVADSVSAYQAEVQERLRRAELERAAADAREQEARATAAAERKARRRTRALAAAVVLLVAGSVTGALWMQQQRAAAQVRQAQADHEALAVLERAAASLDEGWRLQDLGKLAAVKLDAERAAGIARNGGASHGVEQQVIAFQAEVRERFARAEKNQVLLTSLLDITQPHEIRAYEVLASGQVMALAEASADEKYAAAFRHRWPDLDIDRQRESSVAARLREEPETVLEGVIGGLDSWLLERRGQKRPETEWRHLLEVVKQLDPSEPRRQLRVLLLGAVPPSVETVAGFLAGWPSWSALADLVRGHDWRHLRELRGRINAAEEPVLTVLLLARASSDIGDLAGAEEVLYQALARRPDEVALLDALAKVLERQGRLAEAIGCYRAARARHPGLGFSLGRALDEAGQYQEAEAIFRDLIRQYPTNPEMLSYLGVTLSHQGKDVDAEVAERKAIALKPDFVAAYNNLGNALYGQKKSAEAEATYRKGIELNPNVAECYVNLGSLLFEQGKYAEMEAACRKALVLKPHHAGAHLGLGIALSAQGKHAEVETAYRNAIQLKLDYAVVYINLGNTLSRQGKYVEAEAAFRKAIALNPDLDLAYYNLGLALFRQRRSAEAEAAYFKSITLNPKFADAYYDLGIALSFQGKYLAAEAANRKAIELKPNFAEAYVHLAQTLREQGRFSEALTAVKRGHELGSKQSGWHYPSPQWVREAEHFVELEKMLPAILEGAASPANSSDIMDLAQMCQQPCKKRYAASARLYADAFNIDPKLASELDEQHAFSDVHQRHRYNAARSAALAAAGQGEDAHLLPNKAVVMFRRWALRWLRDDLALYANLMKHGDPDAQQRVRKNLRHWLEDSDLVGVRDPAALAKLPEAEREAWAKLWADVNTLAANHHAAADAEQIMR